MFGLRFPLGKLQCQMTAISSDYVPVPSGQNYFQHNHSSYELHYAARGSCTLSLSEREHLFSAGHVALVPPGTYHQIRQMSEDFEKMDMIFDLAVSGPLDAGAGETRVLRAFQEFRMLALDELSPHSSLKQDLEQVRLLVQQYDEDPFLFRERLRACSALLLLDLYAALNTGVHVPLQTAVVSKSVNTTIDEFFSFNYNGARSSAELADRLHVGVRHLNRILQQTYGMSYREKLNEVRLVVAKNFLTTTQKSIAEISELLGYSSAANFSAFIKSKTGRTPSQLRSQARINSAGDNEEAWDRG